MALKKLGGGQGFLKAGFLGFQGSGKTYTACLLACAVRKRFKIKSPIAMVDSENATAYVAPMVKALTGEDLIGDRTRDFGSLISLTEECVQEKVGILIADSMTHYWRNLCDSYLAGINEHRLSKGWSPRKKLEFQDWAELKSQWSRWTNLFLNAPLHIIICGRAGYEYDMEKDEESGKKELVKTGIKMKTEGEFGFEPSLLVQMELEQQPVSDGKFKQVRTATVLKDRFGVIDGSVFGFSKGESREDEMERVWSAFEPHISGLMPGSHSTVVTTTTPMAIGEDGDAEWTREKKARTILCEEIQGVIVEKYPGQSAEDKKAKAGLMAQYFGTRSWTAIESMNSNQLREGLYRLKEGLGVRDPGDTPAKIAGSGDDNVPMEPSKTAQDAPGGVNAPSTPPKPQEGMVPPQGNPSKAEVTPLEACQFLLFKAKPAITESQLLQTMAELGSVRTQCGSLQELALSEPHVLQVVAEQWGSFHKATLEKFAIQ